LIVPFCAFDINFSQQPQQQTSLTLATELMRLVGQLPQRIIDTIADVTRLGLEVCYDCHHPKQH
jgi:hypothetical protein